MGMSQYVVLNSLGIIKDKDLDEYCTENGILAVILTMETQEFLLQLDH